MALIDDLATMVQTLSGLGNCITLRILGEANDLLREYDALKKQEVEEAQLTEENLIDEAFDYTALGPEYYG